MGLLIVRLAPAGAGVGAELALRAAGWALVPALAVGAAVIYGTYRISWRLILVAARRRDARR
jgi:hypothetical protein